jgi:DNA-binding MarR family transcriptional regulator
MDVRRLLGVTSATLSETLQILERLGLITRHPHYTDGRARRIELTAEGRKRTAACIEKWVDSRAGYRMVQKIFKFKHDPVPLFNTLDDFQGHLGLTELWFTGNTLRLYPDFHPDD